MTIELNKIYQTYSEHCDSYSVMAIKVKKWSNKFKGVIVEASSPLMVGRVGMFYKNGFK